MGTDTEGDLHLVTGCVPLLSVFSVRKLVPVSIAQGDILARTCTFVTCFVSGEATYKTGMNEWHKHQTQCWLKLEPGPVFGLGP